MMQRRSRTAKLWLALVAASALAACSADSDKQMDRARASYEAGEWDEARLDLVAVLKEDRDNAEALELLARTYLEMGEGDRAKAQLEDLRETGGALPQDFATLLAEAELVRGQPQMALDALEGVETASAYRMRAEIQAGEGRYDDARETLLEGVAVADDGSGEKARLQAEYALFRIADGELAEAERYVALTTRGAPDAARSRLAAGRLAIAREDYDAAVAELKPAVERYPRDIELLEALARSYGMAGRNDALEALLEDAAPRASGSPAFVIMQARLAGDREDWGQVRSLLQPIESELTDRPPDDFLYVTALSKLGQTELAYNRLKRLTRRYPGNADAEAMLRRLSAQL